LPKNHPKTFKNRKKSSKICQIPIAPAEKIAILTKSDLLLKENSPILTRNDQTQFSPRQREISTYVRKNRCANALLSQQPPCPIFHFAHVKYLNYQLNIRDTLDL
jgi:hypothetical protein